MGTELELASIEAVRRVCDKYGFSFSKDLGQNFLTDPRVPRDIARGAQIEGENVLEIGPGMGTLTAELGALARSVCALELDRRLIPVLGETLAHLDNVRVVWGDVMKTDLSALADECFGKGAPVCAVSNLPYCITTPAILRLLGTGRFSSVTVMIQKEAAKKLICAPGEPEWCLFSALAAYRAEIKKLFPVSKGCFYPQPKVDSTVLRMECRQVPPESEVPFERVAKAIFAQRRKTVRNTLSAMPGVGADGAQSLLERAGLDPLRRGETLTSEEIALVAGLMVQTIQKDSV